jgi:hypothetical protein
LIKSLPVEASDEISRSSSVIGVEDNNGDEDIFKIGNGIIKPVVLRFGSFSFSFSFGVNIGYDNNEDGNCVSIFISSILRFFSRLFGMDRLETIGIEDGNGVGIGTCICGGAGFDNSIQRLINACDTSVIVIIDGILTFSKLESMGIICSSVLNCNNLLFYKK